MPVDDRVAPPAQQDVDEEVDHDEPDGQHHHGALQRHEVAVVDRVDREPAEAGQGISLKAGTDLHIKIGTNSGLDSGMNVHIKGGMNVVINAHESSRPRAQARLNTG